MDLTTRKGLISVNTMLSVKRQSDLLAVNRTSVYYVPVEKSLTYENQIKERLDYWHTKMPYLGVRKLKIKLALKLSDDQLGIEVGRKLIKRCMVEMGIYAMYPKPNLSKRNLKHKIHPYLLRNLAIEQPNQVWPSTSLTSKWVETTFT